jgi:hypothetical protein
MRAWEGVRQTRTEKDMIQNFIGSLQIFKRLIKINDGTQKVHPPSYMA